MARLNAPRPAGNRPDPAQQDQPSSVPSKGWPFAKGSQNKLDETAAHWPRPASRSAIARSDQTPK